MELFAAMVYLRSLPEIHTQLRTVPIKSPTAIQICPIQKNKWLREDPSEAIRSYQKPVQKVLPPIRSVLVLQGNNPLSWRSFHVNRADDDHHGKVKHKSNQNYHCCTTQFFSSSVIKSAVTKSSDSKITYFILYHRRV